ncbi:MAG: hypothetical protein R6V19_16070 [Armatimonadota bacterium]
MRSRGTFKILENLAVWHVLIIAFVGALLIGLLVAFLWPSTYRAYSSFLLPDSRLNAASGAGQNVNLDVGDPQQKQDRLWTVIVSRSLRKKLVQKHDLDEKFGVEVGYAVDMLEYITRVETIGGGGLKIICTLTGSKQFPLGLGHPLSEKEARELCAELANSYLEELDDFVRETNVATAQRQRKLLQQSKEEVETELQNTEQRLQQLQEQFDLIDPDSKTSRVVQRILSVQQAADNASAEVDDTATALREARSQLDQVDARRVASQAKMRNPVISNLEAELAELQVELATEMASGKTANNRDVQQIQTAIDNIKQQLRSVEAEVLKEASEQVNPAYDEVVGKVVNLEVALAGAKARQAKYASLKSSAQAELSMLPAIARDYAAIKREQTVQSNLLTSLTESLAQAQLQERTARSSDIFTVLDRAEAPSRRSSPTTWVVVLVTFIVLFVGFGLLLVDKRLFGIYR